MPRRTLAAQHITDLIASAAIHSDAGIAEDQIQPASLDLCLSAEAYRMPGSMLALPGEKVRDIVDGLALEQLNLSSPTCLARGQVYLVRLREHLALDADIEAYTNSKSSTGRIDLATRVLSDGNPRYDRIRAGYRGELWLELTPRSFDIVARSGDSLNQAIFFAGREVLDQSELLAEHATKPLLYDHNGQAVAAEQCIIDGRLVLSADLQADIVGWVARRSHRPIDLGHCQHHNPADYFSPVTRPESGYLFLEKDRFYILASAERILVPADLACEMVPYDPASGEFRAHYAGFFDPGWGLLDGQGTGAVLEVRPHEDDLILRHGQPICAMAYERLSHPCQNLYGSRSNNYATQRGPRLSKHFKQT